MSVAVMLVSVVPMSWIRQVRQYVSAKDGVSHVGKEDWAIAMPGKKKSPSGDV